MAMKFKSTLASLKSALKRQGVVESCDVQPNGAYMLRCADGANLHWANGSKSLWYDGKVPASGKREIAIGYMLNSEMVPA